MEQPQSDPRGSRPTTPPNIPPAQPVEEPEKESRPGHKAAVYTRPVIDRKMKYILYALLIGALLFLFFIEPLIHNVQR